jgi:hypothetical protein
MKSIGGKSRLCSFLYIGMRHVCTCTVEKIYRETITIRILVTRSGGWQLPSEQVKNKFAKTIFGYSRTIRSRKHVLNIGCR